MKKSIIVMAMLLVSLSTMAAPLHKEKTVAVSSKTFILVHGAWQAPWVWDDVAKGLRKAGKNVIVIELPGHGTDQTAPVSINLNAYRDKVIAAIKPVRGKVVLVGHSMAGMVVSAVTEAIPNQVEKVVYIGAYVPANGQSLMQLAGTDAQSILGPNLVPSADQLTLDVKKAQVINIFCHDGSDAVKELLMTNYRAEPAIPFGDKVILTDENFGKADKYYLFTLQDHAVGIDLQHTMVKAAGITKTYELNSSHCPFLSMPGQVTSILLRIAK